jgi:hypothetical protein
MKKPLVLVLAVTCIVFNTPAQSILGRKLSPAEAAYCNTVYSVMAAALPHTYRDWIFADAGKNLPEGQPYTVRLDYAYEMPEEQAKTIMSSAYKKIGDPNSVKQVASALKWAAINRLKIMVTANMPQQNPNSLVYCGKVTPAITGLPVAATLSIMGMHTENCPIMTHTKVDMNGDYYDNAIVFLGKPVVKKKTEQVENGLISTIYYVGFDKEKMNQLITQNIVVTLKGDAANINEVIKLIDWQKLYGLLNK